MSWRQVAAATELEPSTLQRIVAGSTPDLARFVVLLDWLGVPADEFITREQTILSVDLPGAQRIELHRAGRRPLSAAQLKHLRAAFDSVIQALES